MGLVEALGQFQGFVCGKVQVAVGVPLQAGQVVELGRRLPLAGGFGGEHPAGLPLHLRGDGLCLGFVGNMGVGVQPLPEPYPVIVPEGSRQGAETFGLESGDLLMALDQNGQGRGLHPAHGKQGVIAQGEGPGGVHPHQPVRLGAAHGAAVQPVIVRAGAYVPEALLNGFVGHGADPQAGDGLAAAAFLINIAEDQFALPPGVRSADDTVGLRSIHQPGNDVVLSLGCREHFQGDGLGQYGQGLVAPALVLGVQLVGFAQAHQVADGPGDDVCFADQAALAPLPAAQHPGNVLAHAGLLRHHQGFRHGSTSLFLIVA